MVHRRFGLVRLAFLLALIAPVWLGPAMMPLVHALGGEPTHTCACGMKRGTCGCPACAALERERTSKYVSTNPVVRNTCDDDEVAPTPAAPCVPAFASGLVVASSSVRAAAPLFAPQPICHNLDEPPTPPPRSANV